MTELTLVFVVRLPADAVEAFPLEAASHFAMIIDNVEALRSWLTDKLRPMYVYVTYYFTSTNHCDVS